MQAARKPRLHEVIDAEKATLLHGVMNDPVPWRHVLTEQRGVLHRFCVGVL